MILNDDVKESLSDIIGGSIDVSDVITLLVCVESQIHEPGYNKEEIKGIINSCIDYLEYE